MKRLIACCALALAVVGCAQTTRSTSLSSVPGHIDKIQFVKKLPAKLPEGAHAFPGEQYVLLPQDQAATLLVPVPFVGEFVVAQMADAEASSAATRYAKLDPYQISVAAASTSSLFGTAASPAKLYPFVFVTESHDRRYRLSLAFHVEDASWMGRYYYHLPTTLPISALKTPTPQELDTLRRELDAGARTLATLVEWDKNGQLKPTGRKAKFGSLYIVGGNLVGLVSPEALVFPGAEILYTSGDRVVLRHDGNPTGPGQSGALLFGVHHFHLNQMHHFEVQ